MLYAMVLFLLSTGCSHTYQFNPSPKIDALKDTKISGKKLALDLANTPESFSDRASGHKFKIVGIRVHADHMARSFFQNETFVENQAEADIILKLNLKFDISTALLGGKCTCKAVWNFRETNGSALSTGTSSKGASFPVIANVGRNCEISAIQAIAEALDGALENLS